MTRESHDTRWHSNVKVVHRKRSYLVIYRQGVGLPQRVVFRHPSLARAEKRAKDIRGRVTEW
jgi:hypothetical protein